MSAPDAPEKTSSDLRRRAEELLHRRTSKSETAVPLSTTDIDVVNHELEVHQIELEMQDGELRKSQELLLESRDKYSKLYDYAPVGYFTLDKFGLILEVNLTGAQLLGYDRRYLIGKPFQRRVSEAHRDLFRHHRDEVFTTLTQKKCEVELQRSDGTSFYAQLESRAAEGSDEKPKRCLMIVSDVTERRLAQKAMQMAHRDWERTFNSISDRIMVLDGEHKILRVNNAMAAAIGLTEQETVGKSCFELVHGEKEPPAFCPHSQLLADGEAHSVELEDPRLGGIYDVRVTPLFDEAGQVVGSVHVSRDITERKRAEDVLRQLEREKSLILESAAEMFTYLDLDLRVRWANKAAADAVGQKSEDLIGKHCYETWLGRREPCEDCPVVRARGTGLPQKGEQTSPDGRTWFLRGYPVKDEKGKTVGLVEFIQDITERKKAEDALRQSEERFRAIFESTTDCVWVKDRALKYTHVNSAMSKLLGLPVSKIIGRHAGDIFGQEPGDQLEELEKRVLSGESIDLERTRTVRGTTLTFHDTMVPLRDSAGHIIGLCCICRNITERKKATEPAPINGRAYVAPAMLAALEQARLAAASDGIVLLQGESGSGKDFLARWIHDHSTRSNGPFFSVNCAAVSKELAESELFGHERGSFTGAVGMKKGLLELAEGGTILLNEIGELPLSLQSKLLTFLDTRSFMRVGGQRHVYVNARLIAATHRDLRSEVREKRFLEPLFYRLNVLPIRVPPLRERVEDLPVLVEEIMAKLASQLQLPEMPAIDAGVIASLNEYGWPGNVRELRNVLERSLIIWRGGPFILDMPRTQRPDGETGRSEWSYLVNFSRGKGLDEAVQELGMSLYEHAMRTAKGNKNEAAKLLKISRGALYRYRKKWEGKDKT